MKTRRKPAEAFLPKQGKLNTYRLLETESLSGKRTLLVDLGFSTFRDLSQRPKRKFRGGEIVEWKGGSRLVKSRRASEKDLFTYNGSFERIIDGDTFWVKIDLGFGVSTRQKLRLRGVDTPEMKTRAGKKAKRFVEEELKSVSSVILTTTKPDKYDRYLSDIYYRGICLNKRLLETGHARLASNA